MIRIAMLSYWHVHAWDYTKQAQQHPDTVVAAVWDEIPERGMKAAEQLGVPFFANLDDILAHQEIDAVVVDAPTNMHHDIMIRAARAGKHIFTEKVIAPTVSEVDDILAAVEAAGVKLTVSLPRLNEHYTSAISQVLDQKLLGQVTMVRSRLSHNGATAGWLPEHFFHLQQCGGGALIDLGCHPMVLTRLFLGMPEQVNATYGYVTGKEVEDNAVAVLRRSDGAIGIVEAGFVNNHSPFSIEIHGTEGTLLYGFPDDRILMRSSQQADQEWTVIDGGTKRESAFEQWVQHIHKDTQAVENIQLARDLTVLMEASNRSAREQRPVRIDELI